MRASSVINDHENWVPWMFLRPELVTGQFVFKDKARALPFKGSSLNVLWDCRCKWLRKHRSRGCKLSTPGEADSHKKRGKLELILQTSTIKVRLTKTLLKHQTLFQVVCTYLLNNTLWEVGLFISSIGKCCILDTVVRNTTEVWTKQFNFKYYFVIQNCTLPNVWILSVLYLYLFYSQQTKQDTKEQTKQSRIMLAKNTGEPGEHASGLPWGQKQAGTQKFRIVSVGCLNEITASCWNSSLKSPIFSGPGSSNIFFLKRLRKSRYWQIFKLVQAY